MARRKISLWRAEMRPTTLARALILVVASLLLGGFGLAPSSHGLVFPVNGEEQEIARSNFRQLGIAHLRAGRIGRALQALRLAAHQDPGSIETLNAIAVSYDRLGRFDLSHRYFTQALFLEPASAQTLNNIGRSLLAQGQVDLASAYLRQARRHDGTRPVILANLQLAAVMTCDLKC